MEEKESGKRRIMQKLKILQIEKTKIEESKQKDVIK